MPHLIEIPATSPVPERLLLREGDVVRLSATGAGGAHDGIVELLGPLQPGTAGPDGEILAPAGIPAVVLLVARRPGTTTVDVARGGFGRMPSEPASVATVEVVVLDPDRAVDAR